MTDISKVLKEILIKAYRDYKARESEGKTVLSQSSLAQIVGITPSALSRYLNEKGTATPDLVEVMELLRVMKQQKFLLELTKKSKSSAAKFIKAYYPQYIEYEIEEQVEEFDSNDEILRQTFENQQKLEGRFKKIFEGTGTFNWMFLLLSITLMFITFKSSEYDRKFEVIYGGITEVLEKCVGD